MIKKYWLLNKGFMVLEPIESIFCSHLFEEQHQYKNHCGGVLSCSSSAYPLENSHTRVPDIVYTFMTRTR
jgi:hypothetical protein